MYINNARYSTFIVKGMPGETKKGSIALWLDIGTIGYFKDLKLQPGKTVRNLDLLIKSQ